MSLPKPEELGQLPEIEKQWAVKAMHHAETYMNLLQVMDGANLRLTNIDDELLADFRTNFPDMDVRMLNEEDFKTEDAKKKWREMIMPYEKRITDYNFGSLLRIDVTKDYTEENTMFAMRTQFLCIEIARNREGLNSFLYKKA
ncbi:putative polysaccharide biosynthesis protein [Syncephalis plumigaleata]|nr:putative polysaccharide biosynthesis protein [Syncephalis plumigaleata]